MPKKFCSYLTIALSCIPLVLAVWVLTTRSDGIERSLTENHIRDEVAQRAKVSTGVWREFVDGEKGDDADVARKWMSKEARRPTMYQRRRGAMRTQNLLGPGRRSGLVLLKLLRQFQREVGMYE